MRLVLMLVPMVLSLPSLADDASYYLEQMETKIEAYSKFSTAKIGKIHEAQAAFLVDVKSAQKALAQSKSSHDKYYSAIQTAIETKAALRGVFRNGYVPLLASREIVELVIADEDAHYAPLAYSIVLSMGYRNQHLYGEYQKLAHRVYRRIEFVAYVLGLQYSIRDTKYFHYVLELKNEDQLEIFKELLAAGFKDSDYFKQALQARNPEQVKRFKEGVRRKVYDIGYYKHGVK